MSADIPRRSYLKRIGAAGLATVPLAGCTGGGDGSDGSDGGESTGTTMGEQDDSPIVLGNLGPFSGPQSFIGQAFRNGMTYAVNELNQEGGIMGRDVELVRTDSQADPETATTAFSRMVENDGVSAVLGPVSSDVGIQLSELSHEMQVPVLYHFCTSIATVKPGNHYQFRTTNAPGRSMWRLVANLVQEKDWTHMAAIFADYSYGQNQFEGFQEYVKPLESISTESYTASLTASDYSSILRQLSDDTDVLAVTGHPVGAYTITAQAFELGMEFEDIIGSGASGDTWYGAIGDKITQGVTEMRSVDQTTSSYIETATGYAEQNDGGFNNFHYSGYAVTQLAVQAIEQAGTSEPTAIRDALVSNTFDIGYIYDLNYTDFGEMTDWTRAFVSFESGGYEARPDAAFHPVIDTIPESINPSEVEPYET